MIAVVFVLVCFLVLALGSQAFVAAGIEGRHPTRFA